MKKLALLLQPLNYGLLSRSHGHLPLIPGEPSRKYQRIRPPHRGNCELKTEVLLNKSTHIIALAPSLLAA